MNNRCGIHEIKPFECSVMLCYGMTKDKPMYLGKGYYHHKWKDSQDIPFSMFPELKNMVGKLRTSVEWLKRSFEEKNQIMSEITTLLNSQPKEESNDV